MAPNARNIACATVFGLLGVGLLLAGCILIAVFTNLIHNKVDSSLPLTNGSDSYSHWKSPPSPIYFQIWMWHVTNPDEVINGGKPALLQKGPYTYREKREKVGIQFSDNNTVLTYREKIWYYFEPSLSYGSEMDNVTTVNLPMLTIANLVRFEYSIIKVVMEIILVLTDEHLFITRPVGQLLWGYEDNLLKKVKDILAEFNITFNLDDKFGLFYQKNGSDDGLYQIYSGVDTVDHVGQIITWNGNRSLNFWTDKIANMLNGSDGTMYPPNIDTGHSFYLFSSDLCRSLEIAYATSYSLKGIDLKRYTVPPHTFENSTANPYNAGFCTPAKNCLPSGVMNASTCRQGAPVIFSLPHFLDADPEILDGVVGLHPNREEHQSVIDIEPMTGLTMNVAKRLQLNAFVQNITGIRETENIPKPIYFPVMWLNESASIDDKSATDFKSELLDKIKITKIVQYTLIALGSFIILLVILFIIFKLARRATNVQQQDTVTDTTPIINPEM